MSGQAALTDILRNIDRRSYRAYKDIAGGYDFGECQLFIDHVQGDPFAAPSKLRVRVPMRHARLPAELFADAAGHLAMCDYLARSVRRALHAAGSQARGSGKSGQVAVDAGAQEVLERSAVVLTEQWVEVRLTAGLPAQGRSVLGREANTMLVETIPEAVHVGLLMENLDRAHMESFVYCVRNQAFIRGQLSQRGLVAFVADGSVLPRASGDSDRPLAQGAVPWRSPESLSVHFDLPHATLDGRTRLTGTGIPRGVTLIVGGGYHGKSTLLAALQRGIYPHVPGDGREYVITDDSAVKIRAEDGRSIQGVDISPFIGDLPQGRSTVAFSSQDASGSTSQAANIIEALECGARCLLLDEDTCATNFMVQDARMQSLVHPEHEPITPFVDRIRELHEVQGTSTVLVMGGSGAYFEAADTVIMMRGYEAHDVTAAARTIAEAHPTQRQPRAPHEWSARADRVPESDSVKPSRGRRDVRVDAKGLDRILFGTDSIELRAVEQIVDGSQTRAIGHALALARSFMHSGATLQDVLHQIESAIDEGGLGVLDPYHRPGQHPGDYARPRRFEIAAALNRLRSLRCTVRQEGTKHG